MSEPEKKYPARDWPDLAGEALQVLKNAGCDFADVYLEESAGGRVKMEEGRIDQVAQGGEFGAGLRLVRGEQTVFASTNDVTPAGLRGAAASLVKAAGAGADSVESAYRAAPRIKRPGLEKPAGVAWETRLGAAREAEAAGRAAGPHLRQVTVFLGWNEQRIGIARSDGGWCEDERTQVVLWVNAVAQSGEKMQTGFESAGGSQGWEYFREHGAGATGRLAAERAERLLTARPAPAGRCPVVLAAEAGGTMIHEAVGHALEADLVQKGLSPYGALLGQQVANVCVSVADDATLTGWRGSFACDDEGTPAQRTLLVERGILKGFLHDRLTARKAGAAPTGNGRRQSHPAHDQHHDSARGRRRPGHHPLGAPRALRGAHGRWTSEHGQRGFRV
jgi:TldD protein